VFVDSIWVDCWPLPTDLPLRTEAARHGAVGKSHGAAWTWTDPLLESLPTKVYDAERPPVA